MTTGVSVPRTRPSQETKMKLQRRQFVSGLTLLPAAALLPSFVRAQDKWPSKPIKLLVGFPAGRRRRRDGAADRRTSSPSGSAAGRRREQDRRHRHDLLRHRRQERRRTATRCSWRTSTPTPSARCWSRRASSIRSTTSRRSRLLGITPQVLAHHPKHKFKDVPDLIAYAKANPGKLTFTSSGVGSAQHIAGEDFKLQRRHRHAARAVQGHGRGDGGAALGRGRHDLQLDRARRCRR